MSESPFNQTTNSSLLSNLKLGDIGTNVNNNTRDFMSFIEYLNAYYYNIITGGES
jgi:hypothetical protein